MNKLKFQFHSPCHTEFRSACDQKTRNICTIQYNANNYPVNVISRDLLIFNWGGGPMGLHPPFLFHIRFLSRTLTVPQHLLAYINFFLQFLQDYFPRFGTWYDCTLCAILGDGGGLQGDDPPSSNRLLNVIHKKFNFS